MNTHQSIDQQEREFKELLERVMHGPLSPISNSIKELKERMDNMEKQVKDIHEKGLSPLSIATTETGKKIKSLEYFIKEDAPREVCEALQPMLAQLQEIIELRLHQNISQVAKQQEIIAQSQGMIELSQKQGFDHLNNLQKTTLSQMKSESESLRGEVSNQLTEQSANGERTFVRIQETLSLHSQELRQQSNSGFRQLNDEAHTRMLQLTQSIEQLQIILNTQQQQLERLQQQEAVNSDRLGEQVQHTFLPIKKWIITSAFLAAASLTSMLILVQEKL